MTIDEEKAKEILNRVLDRIPELEEFNTPENYKQERIFKQWRNETEDTLRNIFGERSVHVLRIQKVSYFPMFAPASNQTKIEFYKSGLGSAEAILNAAIKEINTFGLKYISSESIDKEKSKEEIKIYNVINNYQKNLNAVSQNVTIETSFKALINTIKETELKQKEKEDAISRVTEIEEGVKQGKITLSELKEKISQFSEKYSFLKPVLLRLLNEIIKMWIGSA